MNDLKENKARPVVFGEVLFDDFEDGPSVIGGAAFNLAWTCRDCVYQQPATGACTVGWPNDILSNAVNAVVDDDGFPAFCKAFEPE